jgi:hypothetical protein
MNLRHPIISLAAMALLLGTEARARTGPAYVCETWVPMPNGGEVRVWRNFAVGDPWQYVSGHWWITEPNQSNTPLLRAEWSSDKPSDLAHLRGSLFVNRYFMPPLEGVHGKTRLWIRPCESTTRCGYNVAILSTRFIGTAGEIHSAVQWDTVVSVAKQWGEIFLVLEDENHKEVWKERIGLDVLLDAERQFRLLVEKTGTMALDYKQYCRRNETIVVPG